MTIAETDRYHLHQQLEDALDERGAATMMELLPPVGWADVATNRDLDQLEQRMALRFDNVDLRFQGVEQRFQGIEEQFNRVDERFGQVDQRFNQVDERFNQVDERFDQVDFRFNLVEEQITDKIDASASKLRAEIVDTGRKLQAVLLPAIVAGIGFLAALSVWGPG